MEIDKKAPKETPTKTVNKLQIKIISSNNIHSVNQILPDNNNKKRNKKIYKLSVKKHKKLSKKQKNYKKKTQKHTSVLKDKHSNEIKNVVKKHTQKPLLHEDKKIHKIKDKKTIHNNTVSPHNSSEIEPKKNLTVKTAIKKITSNHITDNKKKLSKNYLTYIRRTIISKTKYPKRAKRLKKQGIVLVSFIIKNNGNITKINIEKSSGSKILDNAAIKTLKNINKFKEIPSQLKRNSWNIKIPMVYKLK
jgi:protein TonB